MIKKLIKRLGKVNSLFLGIFLVSAAILPFWQMNWPEAKISLGGEKMHVLVAETRYQQYKGLSGRSSLGKYDGMLFKFYPPRRVGMVMRDMNFPIDIIWLHNGKVVDIAPKVQPQPNTAEEKLTVYKPRVKANLVIEVPSGWTREHNIEIGDRLKVLSSE